MVDIPVESLCDDDTLDFNTFVHTYGDFVVRIAYAVVRNPEDAEDIAQERYLMAYVRAKSAELSDDVEEHSAYDPLNIKPLQLEEAQIDEVQIEDFEISTFEIDASPFFPSESEDQL